MMRRVQSEPRLPRVRSEPRLSKASAGSSAYLPGRDPAVYKLTPNSNRKYDVLQQNGIGVQRPASCASRVPGAGRPMYYTEMIKKERTRSASCRERIKAAKRSRNLEQLRDAYRRCFNNKEKEICYVTTREVKPLQVLIRRFHDEELDEAILSDDKKALLKAIENAENDDTIAMSLGEGIPPIMLSRPPKLTEAKLLVETIEKREKRADARKEPEPVPDFSKKKQATPPSSAPPENENDSPPPSPAPSPLVPSGKQNIAAEEETQAVEEKNNTPPQSPQPASVAQAQATTAVGGNESPPQSPDQPVPLADEVPMSPAASEPSKAEKRKSKKSKKSTVNAQTDNVSSSPLVTAEPTPVHDATLEDIHSKQTATPTPRVEKTPAPPPAPENGSTSQTTEEQQPAVPKAALGQAEAQGETAAPKTSATLEAVQGQTAAPKASATLEAVQARLAAVKAKAAPNLEEVKARLAAAKAKAAMAKASVVEKHEATNSTEPEKHEASFL